MPKQPRETAKSIWLDYVYSPDGPHPTTRLVLGVLGWRMRRDGSGAFPGLKVIANRTGLTKRAVITRIQDAEADGWVRVLKIPSKHGLRNQYFPAVPERLLTPQQQHRMLEVEDLIESLSRASDPAPKKGGLDLNEMFWVEGDEDPRTGEGDSPGEYGSPGESHARRGESHARRGEGGSPVPVNEVHPSSIGSSSRESSTGAGARGARPSASSEGGERRRRNRARATDWLRMVRTKGWKPPDEWKDPAVLLSAMEDDAVQFLQALLELEPEQSITPAHLDQLRQAFGPTGVMQFQYYVQNGTPIVAW